MELNLCELLKDCPKGTKLYSPLFGEVEFEEIVANIDDLPIKVKYLHHARCVYFSKDGEKNSKLDTEECMLFPSKENRDWSQWKCPKNRFDPKTLKPFDKVLARNDGVKWTCDFYSHMGYKMFICIGTYWAQIIPYNNDTKHLAGTSDKAPEYYRYWED